MLMQGCRSRHRAHRGWNGLELQRQAPGAQMPIRHEHNPASRHADAALCRTNMCMWAREAGSCPARHEACKRRAGDLGIAGHADAKLSMSSILPLACRCSALTEPKKICRSGLKAPQGRLVGNYKPWRAKHPSTSVEPTYNSTRTHCELGERTTLACTESLVS